MDKWYHLSPFRIIFMIWQLSTPIKKTHTIVSIVLVNNCLCSNGIIGIQRISISRVMPRIKLNIFSNSFLVINFQFLNLMLQTSDYYIAKNICWQNIYLYSVWTEHPRTSVGTSIRISFVNIGKEPKTKKCSDAKCSE